MILRSLSLCLIATGLILATGCRVTQRVAGKIAERRQPPPASAPTFSQYHLQGWMWEDVSRVVVLPFRNESPYNRAAEDVRMAFTSELQKLGRFEVVASPADDRAPHATVIHDSGKFDEAVMLEMARDTRADVVIQATITHYSPYPRPRVGLVIQAVGPREAKVVASVDGVWDTADAAVAERLRTFYRQRPKEKPPWIRNHVIASDDSFSGELALDSPALFLRWVAREASLTLLDLPVPGITHDPNFGQPSPSAPAPSGGNCR